MNEQTEQARQTKYIRALANETRIEIINALALHEGLTVGELFQLIGMSQSATSQHLRILKEAGIVKTSKYQQYHTYTLVDTTPLRILALI